MRSEVPNHRWRSKTLDYLCTILLALSLLLGMPNVLGNRNAWWAHPLAYILSGVVVGIALGDRVARKDGMVPQPEHFQGQPSSLKTFGVLGRNTGIACFGSSNGRTRHILLSGRMP